ncbi:hypothetical protein ILUMI_12128 [Ignelater luminosus]|uniref:RNA-directed DNA polymerase n=1 Tax=Ignelater luminosus TaxID=2038154 RepID=A0A8K0CZ23_IGNLU|nr:hypothetical protein ILUMI_12128 [Ignelater luminosus]
MGLLCPKEQIEVKIKIGEIEKSSKLLITINKYLKDCNYPLSRIEEIFIALQGGQPFTKLDFFNAYNQFVLESKTAVLLSWSTPFGIYKVKRLPYGTKPACQIFQQIIEKRLQGACDSSEYGIGAVLSQVMSDKSERPILFISRILTETEKNYAMVCKEALSIFWAVSKLYEYLAGRKFEIVTDYKSLQMLFGEHKSLPKMASGRFQRKQGSRLSLQIKEDDKFDQLEFLNFLDIAVYIELHSTHEGTRKMMATVRAYFWWPSLDADVERVVSSCEICIAAKPEPKRFGTSAKGNGCLLDEPLRFKENVETSVNMPDIENILPEASRQHCDISTNEQEVFDKHESSISFDSNDKNVLLSRTTSVGVNRSVKCHVRKL